jgi:hypothetical protein
MLISDYMSCTNGRAKSLTFDRLKCETNGLKNAMNDKLNLILKYYTTLSIFEVVKSQ